jgi:esterase/lipase
VKKTLIWILMICMVMCSCFSFTLVQAETNHEKGIIVATGTDVPTDDNLSEEYRFPSKYRENAVQFVTEDGVLLCGYVLGKGSKGITLGHANGWMVKSWLPFAERLVEEGYQVILWEFRNNKPSGSAKGEAGNRWDLDVIAAAQVLRERGATEILSMGASDGGTATAAAAPHIPDLVGLGILSSPSINSNTGGKGKALEGVGKINVPAFFAVSKNDFAGDLYPHVKALYDACSSEQKQFIVIDDSDHGTDMISPEVPGVGYARFPENGEQKRKRQDLADRLMRFVNNTFDKSGDKTDEGVTEAPVSDDNTSIDKADTDNANIDNANTDSTTLDKTDQDSAGTPTSPTKTNGRDAHTEKSNGNIIFNPFIIGGSVLLLLILIAVINRKYKERSGNN